MFQGEPYNQSSWKFWRQELIMGYLLNYAMIDHFLSGNRSCQTVAAVIFLPLFVTFVAAIKTGPHFAVCIVHVRSESSPQPINFAGSKMQWVDEQNSTRLDVIEIITRKVLLWMLTACAKQFAFCLSTCQQLSGLVVPEQTYGWRT